MSTFFQERRARVPLGLRPAAALTKVKPLRERVDDWKEFIRRPEDGATREALRLHERTGRPLGSEGFLTKLEPIAGGLLRPNRPGPKSRERE